MYGGQSMGVYIFTPEDLVRYGSATEEQLEILKEAILGKRDVLIAGSSRSGKTKLVEALTHFIPDDWKIAVVTAYGEFKPFKPNIAVIDTQFDEKPLKNRTDEVISKIKEINPDYVVVDTIHTISVSDLFDALIDDYAFIVTSLAMTNDIKSEAMHWLGITEEVFKRFDIVVSLKRDFRTGGRSIDRIYEVKDGNLEPVL
jgi:type IV secretory pathway ATPase VirB11/archaellum biosynthesis ATPase